MGGWLNLPEGELGSAPLHAQNIFHAQRPAKSRTASCGPSSFSLKLGRSAKRFGPRYVNFPRPPKCRDIMPRRAWALRFIEICLFSREKGD